MNPHRLDLVSLSLFTLIVRTGSISRGAELAHLAVGAASKRISDLESAVGSELFERHSRGVTLTPASRIAKARLSKGSFRAGRSLPTMAPMAPRTLFDKLWQQGHAGAVRRADQGRRGPLGQEEPVPRQEA